MILGLLADFARFGAALALPLVLICPSLVYLVSVAWMARSIRRSQDSSCGVANVTATPELPARPVRPIRWI